MLCGCARPWWQRRRAPWPSPVARASRDRRAAHWRTRRAARAPRRARRGGSSDRRYVHQAAVVPQAVQAALEAERLEIGLEALAVVSDLLHDVVGPAVVERHHLADVAARADEALDGGVAAFCLLVDVLGGKAELLRLDHREERPLDDVEPAVVAMAHRGAERLLGDELGQDDVIVGLRRARSAQRDEPRLIGGEDI